MTFDRKTDKTRARRTNLQSKADRQTAGWTDGTAKRQTRRLIDSRRMNRDVDRQRYRLLTVSNMRTDRSPERKPNRQKE